MTQVVLLHTLVMSHFLLFPEKMSSLLPHLTFFYPQHVPFTFYSLASYCFFLSSPFSLLFICAKFMSPLVLLSYASLHFVSLSYAISCPTVSKITSKSFHRTSVSGLSFVILFICAARVGDADMTGEHVLERGPISGHGNRRHS